MNRSGSSSTVVDALRLGLDPVRVGRFETEITQHPETLVIRTGPGENAPLLICLHPPRLTEFQFAQKARGLTALSAHLAFPRGLHAHLVDLGGARTVGYSWIHYTGNNPSFRQCVEEASDYLDRVLDQLLEELPVDLRSIYILGAEGAALFAGLHAVSRADRFAGVIALAGEIYPDLVAEFSVESSNMPVLWVQGRRSRNVRNGLVRQQADELRNYGFAVDVMLLQGDDAPWHEEESVIIEWLSRKAGIPTPELA